MVRHGRRAYDWEYWPVLVVVLAMIISALIAERAWSLETYWTLPQGSCQGHECRVPVEGDVLAMDAFRNSLVLYQDADKVIIVSCMEAASIEAFLSETGGLPLTTETAEAIKLGPYYLGKSFTDVLTRFPELNGTVEVDGAQVPIVQNLHFQGCE